MSPATVIGDGLRGGTAVGGDGKLSACGAASCFRGTDGSSCDSRVRNSALSGARRIRIRSASAASSSRPWLFQSSARRDRYGTPPSIPSAASAIWTSLARTDSLFSAASDTGVRIARAFFASPRRMARSASATAAGSAAPGDPVRTFTRTTAWRTSSFSGSTENAFPICSRASSGSPASRAASLARRKSGTERGVVSRPFFRCSRASSIRPA